jgi:hypothetical protein
MHIPIPLLGESIEEARYQQCLQRILYAHSLYLRRKESPEASKLYRYYVRLHIRWLAEQHAVEEQQEEDEPSSYAGEWQKFWRGKELCAEVSSTSIASN